MSRQLSQFRMPVSLRQLFPRSSFVGCADIRVSDATEHSAQCGPQMLFAAVPGTRVDGTTFAAEAIDHGASSLLVQRPIPSVSVPQCVVPDVRRAYAELCGALAGFPSRSLGVAGVTGTNGKTTTTWMIRSILQAAGKPTGLLGTIEYNDGVDSCPSGMTTPDSKSLAHWLATMVRRRCTHVAMELSSHALDQHRAAGTQLDVAVVTNVTQDHFDYHHDFESYLNSKARIFGLCKARGCAVINSDDSGSSSLIARAESSLPVITYGLDRAANVTATILEETLQGSRFVMHVGGDEIAVSTKLVGRHNISNSLAAAAAAFSLGASPADIQRGLENLQFVPGRLERIDCRQPFNVFVDYAHTDDALLRCIRFLRGLSTGRVIVVFGAGGDRDCSKRPLLGRAASEADLDVVTSDNPRSESPEQIIKDILSGFTGSAPEPWVEPDRAEAIRWALEQAEPRDCVLVAGKGHEQFQILG
ncbi:MAG: UDP-N-acetylmuramoyl-L-alanyl-D-glutamate--2,6-diaminopimelate ligase, partial [Planctomycetaceae bacterium]